MYMVWAGGGMHSLYPPPGSILASIQFSIDCNFSSTTFSCPHLQNNSHIHFKLVYASKQGLPSHVIESLGKDPDYLTDILKYHIVRQPVHYRELGNNMQLESLSNKTGSIINVNVYQSVSYQTTKITNVLNK